VRDFHITELVITNQSSVDFDRRFEVVSFPSAAWNPSPFSVQYFTRHWTFVKHSTVNHDTDVPCLPASLLERGGR
jgi:hypothetical protein